MRCLSAGWSRLGCMTKAVAIQLAKDFAIMAAALVLFTLAFLAGPYIDERGPRAMSADAGLP